MKEVKEKSVIFVERESYEKEGNTYFSYFVKGNARGKEVKALLTPKDIGGYTLLEIVFGNEMKAELIVKPFEIKDGKNTIKGNTYMVRTVDESGDVYECDLKPLRPSDKSFLEIFLRQKA